MQFSTFHIILSATVIVLLMIVFWRVSLSATDSMSAAGTTLENCANADQRDHCYEEIIPKLYPAYSVSQIFDVIREVREKDASYRFCHVLAHKIGEKVVAEDPNQWLDAIALNPPDGLCSNGYIHGVVGGRFRSDVLAEKQIDDLVPEFSKACEPRPNWMPSDLDRAICYHGMGHLYDFITDADIPKALDICAKTTPDQFRQVCIEGVFMQIYQPLEPDDFQLIARMPQRPSTTTVRSFCALFSSEPRFEGACLRESWPFFAREIISGVGATAFCSGHPNKTEENNCYNTISAIVGRMSLGDSQKAVRACSHFPTERQLTCFLNVAQAVLDEDRTDASKSIELCQLADAEIENGCIDGLIGRARFVFGSNKTDFARFCSFVPEGRRDRCFFERSK